MGDDNNVEKMFKDMKKKKDQAKKNNPKEENNKDKKKENNTTSANKNNNSDGDSDSSSGISNTSGSVTMSRKKKTKYSEYRENLYLDKEIQKKLNETIKIKVGVDVAKENFKKNKWAFKFKLYKYKFAH